MLIKISQTGLAHLAFLREEPIGGQARFYYTGRDDNLPVVLVAKGRRLEVGQIWDASSGHERGFKGFCRTKHEGILVGKLTLHKLVDPASLGEDEQVLLLEMQVEYFQKRFLPLRQR